MDEINNLQKLRGAPGIVYLHEYFLEERHCFMVMELLPGEELFQRMIHNGTFTEVEARNSCRCILKALAFMHEKRMAHRDLKPANVVLAVRKAARATSLHSKTSSSVSHLTLTR
jgi:serine/threonine protein kinase